MGETLLVVDDDELMRRSVAFHLKKAGYDVRTAAAAERALEMARAEPPALVLLDINMPGMSGLEALRAFQDQLSIPVILVTARRREFDEVLGLELGAHDYITKPFDKDVLLARVRAVLRVNRPPAARPSELPAVIRVGDVVIDPERHTVTAGGQPVALSPREYQLLLVLAQAQGRVVTLDDLLDRVWGAGFEGQMQVLYVHIRWLRTKLEEDPQQPRRILTVRGTGYRLVAPAE